MWFVETAVFWLFTVPAHTLLHELGHALAALAVTHRGTAIASIGFSGSPLRLRISRLEVHLRPFTVFFGYFDLDSDEHVPRWPSVLLVAAGPLMSIITAGTCWVASQQLSNTPDLLREILADASTSALVQAAFTVLPIRYPRWLGAYGGIPSDGLRIINLVRGKASSWDDTRGA